MPINIENITDGLTAFLAAAGVIRMDFPWGSIYWVGDKNTGNPFIIRIDIKS